MRDHQKLVHVIACASAVTGCASSPSSWSQCSVIALSSAPVAQREGIGSIPAPAGGTIAPGIYDLTSTTLYDAGVSRMPYAAARAYVFGEGHFEGASGGTTIAGTWSTNGTTLSLALTCRCTRWRCLHGAEASAAPSEVAWLSVFDDGVRPPPWPDAWYTATPTQLVLFEGYGNGGTMVQTYTKR
jgi:hypothetical protein